jgi:hypothetical protein
MKDNSFERAMNQIVNQAEAEQLAELHARRRAIMLGRVRRVALLVGILAVTGVAFYYHQQVNHFVSDKFAALTGKSSTDAQNEASAPNGAAAATVAKAQANAAVRDQVINQVSSGQFDQSVKTSNN